MKKVEVKIENRLGSKVVIAYAYDTDGFQGKGVAKCSPEDEFDLNIGARIATQRAILKLERARVKYYEKQKEWAWQDFCRYSKEVEQAASRGIAIKKNLEDEKHHC